MCKTPCKKTHFCKIVHEIPRLIANQPFLTRYWLINTASQPAQFGAQTGATDNLSIRFVVVHAPSSDPCFAWTCPSFLAEAGAAGLLLAPFLAQALLLSRPVVHAILGQQLRVGIPVQLDAGEQLATRCVQVQADAGSAHARATGAARRRGCHGYACRSRPAVRHLRRDQQPRGLRSRQRPRPMRSQSSRAVLADDKTRHWPQSSFRPARACAAGLHPG